MFLEEIINRMTCALRGFRKAVLTVFSAMIDSIASMLVEYNKISGRIKHLARYGKTYRIRKKNRNKIIKKLRKMRLINA